MMSATAGASAEATKRATPLKRRLPGPPAGAMPPLPARSRPHSTLHIVPLEALRPTQATVGMLAVHAKRQKIESRGRSEKDIAKLIRRRPIPAVRGPQGALYIVDHHHFGLALWKAEVGQACAEIIEDRSSLCWPSFWRAMEESGFLHPYDEDDRRIDAADLPDSLAALRADPYRDLAWAVREAGGYDKSPMPFAEFRWASFFRSHFSRRAVERDFEGTTRKALKLCWSKDALGLPGSLAARR